MLRGDSKENPQLIQKKKKKMEDGLLDIPLKIFKHFACI